MIGALTNHLWQTTLFAIMAGLLSMALRKNRAQVRYWLWLSASLKFLVPFAVLMSLGSHLQLAPAAKAIATPAAVTFVVQQIARPFPETTAPAPAPRNWLPVVIFSVWVCGLAGVALIRVRGWLRIRAAVRASTPLNLRVAVDVRSSPGLLEPGVVGVFRPFLLLPEGIAERLSPTQLEAVLAHELCHVRRRDNLWATVHMLVEAAFWFHPLVWWIGARLVEERERACDEAVLNLGGEPRDYAEALLNVCKLYVESPLVCVAGVTGSDIKRRIEAIMTNRIVLKLTVVKKLALVAAAVTALTVPIGVGVLHVPRLQAQSQPPTQPSAQAQPTRQPQPTPQPPAANRVIAQAQTVPLPRGRGATTPQAAPAGSRPAQAYLMDRIEARYGPPDQIDDRSSDAQNPLRIWRYSYLEDFRSNVEFEFAPGRPMRINLPVPVTFTGVPGVAADLVQKLPAEFLHGDPAPVDSLPGFPFVKNATLQIYPARQYRTLSVPLDFSQSSAVDIMARIQTSSGEDLRGAKQDVTSGVRDFIKVKESTPIPGTYTTNFTLDTGSYVCSVVVREQDTGRMYGETINFEVK